ncbi:MAG: hypothetical protein ABI551_20295, partial [Polyangiaceae bacterium]
MRKAAVALVLIATAGCSRARAFVRHEDPPPLAVAAAPSAAADTADAGAAASTIPNRLVPLASVRLPPCGRPSGCGPWQVSWSADGSEVALLGDDVVTIVDAHGLGPKRRIRVAANALGERCFEAMVPNEGGIDFLDLRTGKAARQFRPRRPLIDDTDGATLALADDCSHWSTSLPVKNAVFDGDLPVRHAFAGLQADDTTSRIVTSGHYLQWNVMHEGRAMTAFEDARSADPGTPTVWFGAGSVLSPDDALVIDSGSDSDPVSPYEDPRRRLGDTRLGGPRLARTADSMDVYALGEFDHAAFCASSQLFATTVGKHIEIHWQEAAASLAEADLPFFPTVVSFSNDGTTLLVTGESAAM